MSLNLEQSDLLSTACHGVYWRTIKREEYRKAYGIARRFFIDCGRAFPIGAKESCLLWSLRYYRGKGGNRANLKYRLAKNKLSRSVNLP